MPIHPTCPLLLFAHGFTYILFSDQSLDSANVYTIFAAKCRTFSMSLWYWVLYNIGFRNLVCKQTKSGLLLNYFIVHSPVQSPVHSPQSMFYTIPFERTLCLGKLHYGQKFTWWPDGIISSGITGSNISASIGNLPSFSTF